MSILNGMWQLKSMELVNPNGVKCYPHGENPIGCIFYLPNGYMSVHHGCKERRNSSVKASIEITSGDEAIEIVKTYMSYYGKYEIKGDTVFHHVEIAMFPNWKGATEVRHFKINNKELILSTSFELADGKNDFAAYWELVNKL